MCGFRLYMRAHKRNQIQEEGKEMCLILTAGVKCLTETGEGYPILHTYKKMYLPTVSVHSSVEKFLMYFLSVDVGRLRNFSNVECFVAKPITSLVE